MPDSTGIAGMAMNAELIFHLVRYRLDARMYHLLMRGLGRKLVLHGATGDDHGRC